MRPYHGRHAEFLYYRATVHTSFVDIVWLAFGSFVLGALIGYMVSYSTYIDNLVHMAPQLGW